MSWQLLVQASPTHMPLAYPTHMSLASPTHMPLPHLHTCRWPILHTCLCLTYTHPLPHLHTCPLPHLHTCPWPHLHTCPLPHLHTCPGRTTPISTGPSHIAMCDWCARCQMCSKCALRYAKMSSWSPATRARLGYVSFAPFYAHPDLHLAPGPAGYPSLRPGRLAVKQQTGHGCETWRIGCMAVSAAVNQVTPS